MIITKNGEIIKNNYNQIFTIEEYQKKNYCLISKEFFIINIEKIDIDKKNGIQINSDENLDIINKNLKFFDVVIINFLNFKDGRPFSLSRNLREIYHFKNEIRASGYILPDQFQFLIKCGFDTVDIDEKKFKTWLNTLKGESGLDYQRR